MDKFKVVITLEDTDTGILHSMQTFPDPDEWNSKKEAAAKQSVAINLGIQIMNGISQLVEEEEVE